MRLYRMTERALSVSSVYWKADKVTHTGQVRLHNLVLQFKSHLVLLLTAIEILHSNGKKVTIGMSDSLTGQNL